MNRRRNALKLENIAIVLLNFNNYSITFECLDYISSQDDKVPVLIVDNGSTNNSVFEIKNKIKNLENVSLLTLEQNLGFARGNNAGISYFRNKGYENIFLMNSDIFLLDTDFITKIQNVQIPANVGVVGVAIIDKKDNNQNPIHSSDSIVRLYFQLLNLWRVKIGIPNMGVKTWINDFLRRKKPEKHLKTNPVSDMLLGKNQYLHGAAFILTKEYFKMFDGLYNRTFLYFEEPILYQMIKKAGMKMFYIDTLKVQHIEDQSSNTVFEKKSRVWINYSINGLKELIRVRRMNLDTLKKFSKTQ